MRILLVRLFAWLVLAGCATAPVEETRAFGNAVVAIKDAGDLLLDAVSAAERRTQVANLRTKKAAYAFSIADAPYLAAVGDPPVVRESLAAFHDHAGDMFSALLADRALANAPASTINADRVMVANFVVVLESLQTTLDQLELAYSQNSSPATLATLVAASSQLAADVETARKTYAAMRRT